LIKLIELQVSLDSDENLGL